MKQILVSAVMSAILGLLAPSWFCHVQDTSAAITLVTLDAKFVQATDRLKPERKLDVKIAGESKRVVYAERYPIKKGHIEDLLTRLQPGDKLQLIADQSSDGILLIREIQLVPPSPLVEQKTED